MIKFKNISKSYNNKQVVKPISFEMNCGDFLCIVGGSGSGKTTLLKMMNGLVLPDSGEIIIDNENIKDVDLIKLRRNMGYVIQGNGLFPHMNVKENIEYVLKLENKKNTDMIVKEMLELVCLDEEVLTKFPHELSGGQQQRVGIARAYANKPKILLMDEPFGALDVITRYHLQKDLKMIHEKTKCTVVFITHDMQEAMFLSTHILVMNDGFVVQHDTKEVVASNPRTEFVRMLMEVGK